MTASARDAALTGVLFAGALAYLWFWPRELNGFDESLYLYEAKRITEGAVMYRDFFQVVTPAWFYMMAGLFALFSTSLETARAAMMVTHGLIGVLIFLLARQVGIRPVLAVLLATTHLVLGYPACPIATPHWCSTLVTLVLLLVALRWPATNVARAGVWGAIAGLLIIVQQQKGIVMAMGIGMILLVDAYRSGNRRWPVLMRRCAAYAAGIGVIVVPVMLAFVAVAGFEEVWRALVRYPLVNYRRMVGGNVPWGGYMPGLVPHGYIIANLPLVIPAAALWLGWQWRTQGVDERSRHHGIVLLIYSVFALWSVYYLPDHLHFSYVAPVWFVMAGWLIETALRLRPAVTAVRALAVMLLFAGGVQSVATMRQWHERCRYQFDSPFGRIDTQNPDADTVYQWFRALFQSAGATHIFAFPTNPALYLITGTENATRYQIVLPGYTDSDQLEEIVADLERRQTEFVIRNFYFRPRALEPLIAYLEKHYTAVPLPPPFKVTNITHVYRRNSADGAGVPPVF